MTEASTKRTPVWASLLIAAVAIGFLVWLRYVVELSTLFHLVAELFAVTVAISTFMVTWNARRYIQNGYLIILGISYLFVAGVDLYHAISYKGMGLIPGATTDLPTQLWIAARYLQAAALVTAPFYVERKASPWRTVVAFATASGVLLAAITTGVFPTAFEEGVGLTTFKVASEYIVAGVMLVGLAMLLRKKDAFDSNVLGLLSGSIVAGIAAELAFTLYTDPFGPANVIGHLLRIVMYYLLYRAIVESSLRRPYEVLFRELSQTAEALRESEARFRSTFEQATLGIGHISLDGEWVHVNRRMSEITGYQIRELEHMSPADLTIDDEDMEGQLTQRLIEGEIDDYRLEKQLVRKDGQSLWVNSARALVHGPDGQPKYQIETIEDISARKAAEIEAARGRELSDALNVIDRTALGTLEPQPLMRRMLTEAVKVLDAEVGALILKERDSWYIRDIIGVPPETMNATVPVTEGSRFHRDMTCQEPVFAESIAGLTEEESAFLKRFGVRSYLTIPLLDGNVQIGALAVAFRTEDHGVTHIELDFIEKLNAMLTVALTNAHRYQAERQIADTLQTAMLGMPPYIDGLELAHVYHSATQLARIGGDFYDVYEVHPGVVVFVLGDVSGKGIEAATLTAMAKSTLRAFAYRDASPGAVFTEANRAIAEQIGEGRFITAVLGVIEVETGEVCMASAGHPAPILCRHGLCVEDDAYRNPPLGLFPEEEYAEYNVKMQVGDKLVMFSDGLIDARSGSDMLGEEGVTAVLDTMRDSTPTEIVDALLEAAENHSGGQLADDIAIVAVRYHGLGKRSS